MVADKRRFQVNRERKHLRQSAPSLDQSLGPFSAASVTSCSKFKVPTMHPILNRLCHILLVSPSTALLLCCSTALLIFPSPTRADIFQWEYINPADPSHGKRQSATLAPDGAGVDAVPGINLSSRNLTMAYLIGAELTGASGTYANLTNADLSEANLTNAYLYGATLTSAEFTGVEVRWANFDNGRDVARDGCGFDLCHPIGTGITLLQFYSTASYQAHDLSGIGLSSHDLARANLAGQNLMNASFALATLTGADFTGAEVRGASFARFGTGTGIMLEQLYLTASYHAGNLSGIGFRGNNLAGANFAGLNVIQDNFKGATLIAPTSGKRTSPILISEMRP
jgi:uncharacterized protein YjbI with pentapeptide repeats